LRLSPVCIGMTPSFIGTELLDRYLAGEATDQERARVAVWLEGHPGASKALSALAAPVLASEQATAEDRDVIWHKFEANVARVSATEPSVFRTISAGPISARSVGKGRPLHNIMRASVMAAAALCAVFVWKTSRGGRSDHSVAHYQTEVGEQKRIQLADGSSVVLAPSSRLDIMADFGGSRRQVLLHGEASFDVRNAAGAPFVVRAGAVDTRVLGTTFTVRHYHDDRAVQVAVITGKVLTSIGEATRVISAGSLARVTDSVVTVTQIPDVRDYTGWTRGQLVFHRTPATELLNSVGRWYGYTFKLSPAAAASLANQNFSVVLNVSDREDMLVMLQGVLNVSMSFDGTTVTLDVRRDTVARRARVRESYSPTQERGR
jgi:transmembrane sensor